MPRTKVPRPKPDRLSDLLARHAKEVHTEQVALGDITKLMESRSVGALLLLFSLPIALPIPMPGISAVFGAVLVLIAGQLAIGCTRAWLPKFLAERSISREKFGRIVEKVLPALRHLEKLVKPRATFLVQDWMRIPIGILCILLSLVVMLPIPFGNVVPSLAISFFALGLIQRDGVVVGIGLAIAGAAFVLVAYTWSAIF